jgi:tetratricopeptide (TPR) repeat protein
VAVQAPAGSGSVLAPRIQANEPHAPEVAPKTEREALFRAADRAQFTERDPARAFELWDRYLAAAPNGSLSPEARYNRAIALARLGRKPEAVQALEPFARGDYGPYRQVEASALVKALSAPQ